MKLVSTIVIVASLAMVGSAFAGSDDYRGDKKLLRLNSLGPRGDLIEGRDPPKNQRMCAQPAVVTVGGKPTRMMVVKVSCLEKHGLTPESSGD